MHQPSSPQTSYLVGVLHLTASTHQNLQECEDNLSVTHEAGEGLQDLPCVAECHLADLAETMRAANEDLADLLRDIGR